MLGILQTARVPDSSFASDKESGTVTAIQAALPEDFLAVNLDPQKFRKKIWLATGITTQVIKIKITAQLVFKLRDSVVLKLPYVAGYTNNIAGNVAVGNTGDFGQGGNFQLYDEALFADFNGSTFIGATPWRLNITCDKIALNITNLQGDAAATFFGFLYVQEEHPY